MNVTPAPTANLMPQPDALALLNDIIPIVHGRGEDHYVEALAVAIDSLTWFPLKSAPRDGTYVMLAVAPMLNFDTPGYVCLGRWVEPAPGEIDLSKRKRERVAVSGGWWSAGKAKRPFRRPVLGWRPVPEYDFEGAGYVPGDVVTINGR